jgi:hypothetical protein
MDVKLCDALYAVCLLAAVPAYASDKADFATCDGLERPGRQGDGMRGAASTIPYTVAIAKAYDTISACTRALASPRLLPTQSLRQANLLRARATASLQLNDPAAALKDLDAAAVATAAQATDPFFARSMGVSLRLLRAIAHAQQGDLPGATSLAQAAAAARPYSLQVQQVAASIEQLARPVGARTPSPWTAISRLDPTAATTALVEEAELGDFASVVAMEANVAPTWPIERLTPMALVVHDPAANQLLSAMLVGLNVAYARAATGDPAGARRDLAEVRTRLAALRPQEVDGTPNAMVSALNTALDGFVGARAREIEARIAVDEHRPSDALATLIAAPLPHDAAAVDLLRALKATATAKDAALVPDPAGFEPDRAASRRRTLSVIAPAALIAPETPRALIDYKKARPDILGAMVGGAFSMGFSLLGGVKRTDGFHSTPNPDGSIKVQFIGNTPSAPLVQEMTLLRAAEITREAKRTTFVIVARQDYTRHMNTTQRGVLISSVATGFKTELTIRCLEPGERSARALDATTVIDALGPLYYEAAAGS